MFPIWYVGHTPLLVYGICLVTGAILCMNWTIRRAQPAIQPHIKEAMVLGMFSMAAGAKLVYWLLTFTPRVGLFGVSMAGVISGSLFSAALYKAWRPHVQITALMDTVSPPLALVLGFFKLGCFFNGCCIGIPTHLPWGVHFPRWPGVVHPVQLYEIALMGLLSLFLTQVDARKTWVGQTTATFLALFGVIHFGLEFLRVDHRPLWWNISLNQWVCLAIALLGMLWLRKQLPERPSTIG